MLKTVLSMRVATALLFIFGVVIGVATFIENDYGTQTARAEIYSARWFEFFLLFFIIVLIYNIIRYKSYKKAKWSIFIFHLSFLIIAIGSALTRYVGYEGIMHIREGQSANSMVSDVKVLQIEATKGEDIALFEKPIFFSSMSKNSIDETLVVGDNEIEIELVDYLPAAEQKLFPDPNGKMVLALKVSTGEKGEDIHLSKGDTYDAGAFVLNFENEKSCIDSKPCFSIIQKQDGLEVKTDFDIETLAMATQEEQNLSKGVNSFEMKKLYRFDSNMIVLRKVYDKASKRYVSDSLKTVNGKPEMATFRVSIGDKSQEISLFPFQGNQGEVKSLNFGDIEVKMSLGAKVIPLPFSIKLNDFQLERYPGSMSPSSYASEVELTDKEKGVDAMPYRIYMNHVLDHRNYRFFQSSYDMDEKGTVLSVNHDPGTLPTYIGYILMIIGMVWNVFAKGSRFQKLLKRTKKLQSASLAILSFMFIALSSPIYSATPTINDKQQKEYIDSIDDKVVDRFSRLTVQGGQGRMKPMDTLARDIITKISGKSSLYGVSPTELVLGMTTNPTYYQKLPMIQISHTRVAKDLGLKKGTKFAKFSDFFDDKMNYKLAQKVTESGRKKATDKNKYDIEIIKIDERLNIAYMVYIGSLIQIFPIPHDANNKWVNPQEAIKKFPPEVSGVIRGIMQHLFSGIEDGRKSGNWKNANQAIDMIGMFQKKFGSKVLISDDMVDMEIKYNELRLFQKLIPLYLVLGVILLIVSFINVLKPSFSLKKSMKFAWIILAIGFGLHVIGMGLRWYIAGHAPWSNSYEALVFISATTIMAGLIFGKKSPFVLTATAILGGVTIAVAHMSFVNPEITNLVAVLKSYWLVIHVAGIISGAGFLGLGSMISLLVLLLFILRSDKRPHIDNSIKELTNIAEMSLIIGLFLYTIGNFLGGVWANESWGRYWGWDSKETWAAVTILIYATVLHLRFTPKLNNLYVFNIASLWAYSSVLMTYFGVNYYLSGMHSYAAGEPVPIPLWVYYGTAGLLVLTLLAYKNRQMK
ncbi:Putative cytochrome C-type biogenesis protein [hydrothermal vent metagenome]|uniref:Putative cytochrome C-type biogenesis protein n=1 Tax=hydrothermal vent metagenome TaxID=652676 RepID=A0A1W1CFS1_9ZZZZ